MVQSPVVFIIFNRPATTSKVFAEIRRAQPNKLFVVADGPSNPDAVEKCRITRAVTENIDWACEVVTNISDINLGCKKRVVTGLDWVFSQVPEAIILEDDCVPHPSFFRFCDEMLERYRDDEQVMSVSGENRQCGNRISRDSYFFARTVHYWGWATWRRAWAQNDIEMTDWPVLRETDWLDSLLNNEAAATYWRRRLDASYDGYTNVWSRAWIYSIWRRNGLSVMPESNLVTNIGFGRDATITTDESSRRAFIPLVGLSFPLRHPPAIVPQQAADDFNFRVYLEPPEPVGLGKLQASMARPLRAMCPLPLLRLIRRVRHVR